MKVSLFITCLADHFAPQVGEAVYRLLRRHGVEVDFPEGQTCCGQPSWNTGHLDDARDFARLYMKAFAKSEYIIQPSGSCAGHVRYFYPEMFPEGSRERQEAIAIGRRTYEFTEFMVRVLGVKDVGARFPGKAVFHNNCHMQRELKVQEEPLEMLRCVRDLEILELPRPDLCCGFGGAFSIKQPEISTAMADDKVDAIAATGANLIVSSDLGCLMHQGGRIEKRGLPIRTLHIAELLWEGVQQNVG